MLNKVRVGAKLKLVRANYRRAVDVGRLSRGGRIVSTFFSLCENVWEGSPSVKSISSGIDTSRGTNDERTEENDAEEEGSLNSLDEKLDETAQVSDIGTEVGAADFSDTEYSNDLVSSKSTRKPRKQVC